MAKAATDITQRSGWMSLLAVSDAAQLANGLDTLVMLPAYEFLRPPEVGGVMVRGRMGGTGTRFNLGEMTVTRCSVRLSSGEVGHAYVQGRDKSHAEQAAVVDAMMQTARADEMRAHVLEPIAAAIDSKRRLRARKAAATKVDFFTMVRGED